jgi:predicted adenylyl cyclase CyaB
MSRLIEVEIRILLKNRKKVERDLITRGARIAYSAELKDYWFCPKSVKNPKEAAIEKIGYALRIRESRDLYTGKTNVSLECKTLADGKTHALCNEHEMPIASVKETRAILSDLGIKEFLAIDKRRVIYVYKGMKFCFDAIKGVGDGLEIELNVKAAGQSSAYKKLISTARSLSINESEILEKSLTHIAMQKLSRF